ncbi:hypothetical protein PIB30_060781 [Stylosanthes scabra]|uniref:Uncharacterized protein n=1 Tax=Stylosanthes scabra TaxID=79078 RepID=A0ABU6TMB5_9FABA|nr:hypothetical protein [Stylosanthes scabra]
MEEGEATDERQRRRSGGDGDGHKVSAVSEEKRVKRRRLWSHSKNRPSPDSVQPSENRPVRWFLSLAVPGCKPSRL